jgi:hypothetical protein
MRTCTSRAASSLLILSILMVGCEKGGGGVGLQGYFEGLKPIKPGEELRVVRVMQFVGGTPPSRRFEVTVDFKDKQLSANPSVLRLEIPESGKAEGALDSGRAAAAFYIKVAKGTKPGMYDFTLRTKWEGGSFSPTTCWVEVKE